MPPAAVKAYTYSITLNDSISVRPNPDCNKGASAISSDPPALGSTPNRLYQVNTIVLSRLFVDCARIAVSIERNAVRSPPVDVVMAISPIVTSSTTLEVSVNSTPPSTIRHDMATSMRRLPMVSPRHDATTLDSAPPAMMPLNTNPASSGENPSRLT
jgi:hypothetical protein